MKYLTHLPAAVGDTSNLQSWIQDNIIPLLLLLIAVMLFVFAQRGDNAKAMRVVGGVVSLSLYSVSPRAAVPTTWAPGSPAW